MSLLLGVAALATRLVGPVVPDYGTATTSDAAAADQVVDAARDAVRTAALVEPAGGQAFMSCAAHDDPPYRAVVHLTFALPRVDPAGRLTDVAKALGAAGWTDTGLGAEHFGTKMTRAGVVAEFYRNTERSDLATLRLSGGCSVVGDHRGGPVWNRLVLTGP